MINHESGQALPLAMMALAFGTLVITPFLSHAGSSLIGSRIYGEAIAYQNACDAGVEHAIWRLTNDSLADQIPDPGDEITYQLDETLNSVNITVTVTANATGGGGGTAGEITDTIIDTLDFGPYGGEAPKIIHISGNVYAVVYTDYANDGWLKTIEVASDGTITDTAIDSLEFDNRTGLWADIIHVTGNIYAIAYRGRNGDGYIKTVDISSTGSIDNSVIDSLEFDNRDCAYPELVQVADDIYAIAYQGNKSDGFIRTVEIASNGNIDNWTIDSLEFDNSNGREPDIIHISGDIYAVAYRGNNRDGYLKTVEIESNGQITNWVVDTFEFNRYECNFPVISHISGDTYAIVYDGDSPSHSVWGGGILTTVAISTSGMITNSILDEGVFDSQRGDVPDITHISGSSYAISYTGNNNDGWLKTLIIENDGSISDEILDSFEFDNQVCYYPDIIPVSGDIFAIAYTGTNWWHGILKTIEITSTEGDVSASYEIESNAGDKTIRAYVNTANGTATIVSWQIE